MPCLYDVCVAIYGYTHMSYPSSTHTHTERSTFCHIYIFCYIWLCTCYICITYVYVPIHRYLSLAYAQVRIVGFWHILINFAIIVCVHGKYFFFPYIYTWLYIAISFACTGTKGGFLAHILIFCYIWLCTWHISIMYIHRKSSLYLPLSSVNLVLKLMGTPDGISTRSG